MNLNKPQQKVVIVNKSKKVIQKKRIIKKKKIQMKREELIQVVQEIKEKDRVPNMDYEENLYRGVNNYYDYQYEKIQRKSLYKGQPFDVDYQEVDDMTAGFLPKPEMLLQIRQGVDDMNYAEFVLTFPNPDGGHASAKNKAITLKNAMMIFDKMCVVQGMNKNRIQQEKSAFFKAFIQMPMYIDPDMQKKLDALQKDLENIEIEQIANTMLDKKNKKKYSWFLQQANLIDQEVQSDDSNSIENTQTQQKQTSVHKTVDSEKSKSQKNEQLYNDNTRSRVIQLLEIRKMNLVGLNQTQKMHPNQQIHYLTMKDRYKMNKQKHIKKQKPSKRQKSTKQEEKKVEKDQKQDNHKVDDVVNKQQIEQIQKAINDNENDENMILIKQIEGEQIQQQEQEEENDEQQEEQEQNDKQQEEQKEDPDMIAIEQQKRNLQKLQANKEKKKKEKQVIMRKLKAQQYNTLIQNKLDELYEQYQINDIDYLLNEKRNYSQGGQFYMRNIKDTDDYELINRNEHPRDFLTLLRYTVMHKLADSGNMFVKSFLSEDRQFILVTVKSSYLKCKLMAEQKGMTKQLELGYADLLSLEPVDQQSRPLRLKQYVNDYESVSKNFVYEEPKKVLNTVDTDGQRIIQDLQKMDEDDFQELLNKKQRRHDGWLRFISEQLRGNLNLEQVQLKGDQPLTRQEWEGYYLYLEFMNYFMKQLRSNIKIYYEQEEYKKNDPSYENDYKYFYEYRFFILKLIFLKSLQGSSSIQLKFKTSWRQKIKKLENIWNKLDFEKPFGSFTPFSLKLNPMKEAIWRTYELNEEGDRSIFMPMEKLKLSHATIQSIINTNYLTSAKILQFYYPLHDDFILRGVRKNPIMVPLFITRTLLKKDQLIGHQKLQKLFSTLSATAENSDFDSDGSSLVVNTAISWSRPWYINIENMRQYFGEKISIYFSFLQYYTHTTMYVIPFAVGSHFALVYIEQDKSSYFYIMLGMSIITNIWNNTFLSTWQSEEQKYSLEYGQENFLKDDTIRPTYHGEYQRNCSDDDMNEIYYSQKKRNRTIAINYFIAILIIILAVISYFGILQFKKTYSDIDILGIINTETIVGIFLSVQIAIFNGLYTAIAFKGNEVENHKFFSSSENNLIFKLFFFNFFNTFQTLFFIAFFGTNELLKSQKICTIKLSKSAEIDDCFKTIKSTISVLFITGLNLSISGFIKQSVTIVIKAQVRKLIDPIRSKIDKSYVGKNRIRPILHGFQVIDSHIEKQQYDLLPFRTSPKFQEIDGTMALYLKIVNQFGYLTLFSVCQPLVFVYSLITNVIYIQTDKITLLSHFQRPIPSGACNIGYWYYILQIISIISIFTNGYVICYTYPQKGDTTNNIKARTVPNQPDDIFLIFVLVSFFIKIVVQMILSDPPILIFSLRKRQKFIVDTVANRLENGQSKLIKQKTNTHIQYTKILNKKEPDINEQLKAMIQTYRVSNCGDDNLNQVQQLR